MSKKRPVVALGLLVWVCLVALPAASAQTLLKEDFSSAPFKGVGGVFIQGASPQTEADPPELPFTVVDGVLRGGNGDNATVTYLLLTGDRSWADISMTCKIRIDGQNIGVVSLVLRAAPKTKPEDPNTWYEFRYTTGNSRVIEEEEASGIEPPETNPNLRIMKVVNGAWTILAESDASQEANIPAINAAGDHNETGAFFRFTAKGNLLQGFMSLDGTNYTKFLEARDDTLKSGLIGFNTYDYNPVFDDLLVEAL